MPYSFHVLLAVMVTTAIAIPAVLTPPPGNGTIHRRSPPTIVDGFTKRQIEQINDAFQDAVELASYMIRLPRASVEPIMAKYFNSADFDDVLTVFHNIVGPDPGVPGGNDELSNLYVSQDFKDPDTGKLACSDKEVMARIRNRQSMGPTIILCNAAFAHGGIGKGYGSVPFFRVPAVACDNFDEHVSYKMDTLGATLLHEYTHWISLMNPPLPRATKDFEYGPEDCRDLNKLRARYNADSYTWCATENLWTTICGKDFKDPREEDSVDPSCGMKVCLR